MTEERIHTKVFRQGHYRKEERSRTKTVLGASPSEDYFSSSETKEQ